jgi:lipid-A-disaccharide synthase-like uncharacterized protein
VTTNIWNTWVVIGFLGQAIFGGRFIIQWIASERRRESHIPVQFWWMSIIGGAITTAYAVHRRDPVFIVGQASGLLVYVRNLMLIYRADRRTTQDSARDRA